MLWMAFMLHNNFLSSRSLIRSKQKATASSVLLLLCSICYELLSPHNFMLHTLLWFSNSLLSCVEQAMLLYSFCREYLCTFHGSSDEIKPHIVLDFRFRLLNIELVSLLFLFWYFYIYCGNIHKIKGATNIAKYSYKT